MFELILAFAAGVLVSALVGILVWRNNKAKWNAIADQLSTYIDQHQDPEALKISLLNLLNKINK